MSHPYSNNQSPLSVANMIPSGIWSPQVPGSGQIEHLFYQPPCQPSFPSSRANWSRNVWSPPTSTGPPPYGFFNNPVPPPFQPQLPNQPPRNSIKWQPSWNTSSTTRTVGIQVTAQQHHAQQAQQPMFVHGQTPCHAPVLSHRLPSARPFKFHPQFQSNRPFQSPPFGFGLGFGVVPAYAAAGAMFYDPPPHPPPGFGYTTNPGVMQPPPPYRPFEYQQRFFTAFPDDKSAAELGFGFQYPRPVAPPEIDNNPWETEPEYNHQPRVQENPVAVVAPQKSAAFGVVGDKRDRSGLGQQPDGLALFPAEDYDPSWDRYSAPTHYDDQENTYSRTVQSVPAPPSTTTEAPVEYQLISNINPVLPPPPIEKSAVPLASLGADMVWDACLAAYEKHFQTPATFRTLSFGVIGEEVATKCDSARYEGSDASSPASTALGTPKDQASTSVLLDAKTKGEYLTTAADEVRDPFTPDPDFKKFTEKILTQTLLTPQVLLLALLYITKVTRNSVYRKELESPSRMIVVALMIANKVLDDNSYRAETFAMVSGLPLAKLNFWEMTFLQALDFQTNIEASEWAEWLKIVIRGKKQLYKEDEDGKVDDLLQELLDSTEPASVHASKKGVDVNDSPPFAFVMPSKSCFAVNTTYALDIDEDPAIKSPHRPIKKRAASDTKYTLARFGEDLTNIPRVA